ncbi:MAG: altronate dehydratase family protein [Lachnospiraceae bacterium]|nr:altronate dehydratase family protein [Lachnospiraceae bacterium]
MQNSIKIHSNDLVAVALQPLQAGSILPVCGTSVTLLEDIPQGHKFALRTIEAGEKIIKYGNPIGIAKVTIPAGAWVHTHNIKTGLGDLLTYTYDKIPTDLPSSEEVYFQGYRRNNGKVGVRNEIWIIPTVGCVNNVATSIERQAKHLISGSIDEIVAFPHPYGCSQMGEDQDHTRQILADLVNHPNAGGVLVLGLGCENCNIDELKKHIGDYDEQRVRFLVAQDCEDEVADALSILEELVQYAGTCKREPISCKELVIGMKCGGSDGLSGITANPVVGSFSDMLIAKGGTTILTEVPEMFGAETLLMNRCEDEVVFNQTVDLINDFKNYFTSHNQTIYENPSPGNKKGGISTLEDKSLGCTQKSGSAPVKGVLSYAEPITGKGLHLLSAPGNDLVASTALAASGAHIVLFTTGRGTPFASPVPTIKISTNSALDTKKHNWIDFNCGQMVEDTSKKELTNQLFSYVLSVASGEKVKAEKAGYHDFAIWKQGVTL